IFGDCALRPCRHSHLFGPCLCAPRQQGGAACRHVAPALRSRGRIRRVGRCSGGVHISAFRAEFCRGLRGIQQFHRTCICVRHHGGCSQPSHHCGGGHYGEGVGAPAAHTARTVHVF